MMIDNFLKYIAMNRLIRKGDRILAAVSGGGDSMVMTDLLIKSGIKFGIAHCNFGLRGQDSVNDEKMVRKYALDHDLKFHCIHFRTSEYARKKRISIEMAARELRYVWFEKTRHEEGYKSIAVAHNMNDNIETLLMNLVRGTGIAGLTGMRPKGNNIIRPMLFATRSEIEEYCRENGILYREDSTNADIRFKRNRIRHKVIPVLKEINPSVEFTLNDTAERLTGISDIVADITLRIRKTIFRKKKDIFTVSIRQLMQYWGNQGLRFELFRPFGITGPLLRNLAKIIEGKTGGEIQTDTHRIIRNRDELLILPKEASDNQPIFIEHPDELRSSGEFASVRFINMKKDLVMDPDPSAAYLDAGRIFFPLIVRNWKSGDYFYPLGMSGKKKLSDYFTDRKFSKIQKENTRILESDGRIVWIVGERIDNRFRITKSTEKILVIKNKKR